MTAPSVRPPAFRCGRLRATPTGGYVSCQINASWKVGLRLRTHKGGPYVDYYFDQIRVCNACRCKLALADVQTDASFARIVRQLTSRGHSPPVRKLSRLVFTHVRMGFESGGE